MNNKTSITLGALISVGVAVPIALMAPPTTVAEVPAPAPIVEVVEVPAPVVEVPAPVVEVSPEIEGDYNHTQYWADEAPTKTNGTATYNPETDTLEWVTVEWGQSEKWECDGSDLDGWGTCSISYDGNGNPTRVVVTDDSDGYHISTTTFRF